jgi:hypothetical protein
MKDSREAALRAFVTLLSTAQTNLDVSIPETSHQLQNFFQGDESEDQKDAPCCSLPGLQLLHNSSQRKENGSHNRSLQQSCADKLSAPCEFTYGTLSHAPKVLLDNLVSSFTYLVKSRLISYIRALETEPAASQIHKKIMVKVLTAPSVKPVELTTVVTSFQPSLETNPSVDGEGARPQDQWRIGLPIIFEVMMDLCILGDTPLTVKLKAPGHCTGHFSRMPGETCLKGVDVELDTNILLQQIMAQARIAAKKALEIAANATQSFISTAGISSTSVSLVSMDSEDELAPLTKIKSDDGDTSMPPPPPRIPKPF